MEQKLILCWTLEIRRYSSRLGVHAYRETLSHANTIAPKANAIHRSQIVMRMILAPVDGGLMVLYIAPFLSVVYRRRRLASRARLRLRVGLLS